MEIKEGLLKYVRVDKVQNKERRLIHVRELRVGSEEVLKRCCGTRHPSSSFVVGAGRAWVSAPPVPWCHALVAMRVVRDNMLYLHHKT